MLKLHDLLNLKEYKRKYKLTPKFYHIILWVVVVILLIFLLESEKGRLALYFADKVVAR